MLIKKPKNTMKQHLIDRAFEIQEKIQSIIPPDDQEWFDSGMYVDPKKSGQVTVIWRDYSWGNGDEEWGFSYSTCGELSGNVPDQYRKQIEDTLDPYKKQTPFKYVSNLPE